MRKTLALITSLCALTVPTISSAQPLDDTGRTFVADTPDAIVCIYNNPQKTRYIYYKTAGVENDLIRYDGPNNNLLHYTLPGGQLVTSLNPQPAPADCVSQQFTLQELIEMDRAYKLLTPIPYPGKLLN